MSVRVVRLLSCTSLCLTTCRANSIGIDVKSETTPKDTMISLLDILKIERLKAYLFCELVAILN